jgi:hypothetical protein
LRLGAPFPQDLLVDLVKAAVRGGELKLFRYGNRFYLDSNEVSRWFNERVLPLSVYLSQNDYVRALAQGFRLAILRAGVVVDFDRARRRDLGQRWSDYARGELGEIGFKRFLEEKFDKKVKLEKRIEASPEEFYSRDISGVEDGGAWREPRLKLSIKTTKFGGEWLDLPGAQVQRSEAFVLVKSGLAIDHLASFLKDWGLLKKLFEVAQTMGEPGFDEGEIRALLESIPSIGGVWVYVSGFALKEDFASDHFELKHKRSKGTTVSVVVRGIGKLSSISGKIEVLGIPGMTSDHVVASCGYLRWKRQEWEELLRKL